MGQEHQTPAPLKGQGMNKYPLWKNLLLILILIIATVYAIPNIFGEKPAVQLSSAIPGAALTNADLKTVTTVLKKAHVTYKSAVIEKKNILVRMPDTDTQLEAHDILKTKLGDQYIIALNLEPATPQWLMSIGAQPMKLGLDLRGGVHFLLQVDTESVLKQRAKGDVRNIGEELRQERVRYSGIAPLKAGGVGVRFRTDQDLSNGMSVLQRRFPDYVWNQDASNGRFQAKGIMTPAALQKVSQYTVDQSMMTLRRRINELGVSEPVVQQQGKDRISVDLPGIQDAAQAKNILGKTATLEFHLVDSEHDASDAASGIVPAGSELFNFMNQPVLLKSRIVLTGDSITGANASFDDAGRPSVSIRLGGGNEALFERITGDSVGQSMAVVYVEIKSHQSKGSKKIVYKKQSKIINVAVIQSALGTNFQITGLSSPQEARNLGLLLRAGALPAPITIVQERTVGPSMGKRNIHLGMLSLEVGMIIIVLFMALYYRMFGLIADLGLLVNVIMLVALLSAIGATLTFPGIAGIVLTVGMAVDYNVLIYERIREEIRNGVTPQLAIHTGYDKAFITIVDANITTLIVALILFALGSGSVKGFAITLTIGLFTSIVSSVTYTRMLTNYIYGSRRVKHLAIGIKGKEK